MNELYDKKRLLDSGGKPLTQSLFLEFNYSDHAVFTFNDEDKEYKGDTYFSLKKLFLKEADPTEYSFAKRYLLGWQHWKRLNENKALKPYFDEWREELEVMLRSEALKNIADQSEDNFQASKYLADKGWEKRGAGRPSKADAEREKDINSRIGDVMEGTLIRMEKYG